ncbi:ubiquinol-cytochrome c reductase iron-sulfur subunit [Arthrobacter sp. HMSC08H08]|uniref:QcrA and Rieske domain-containing protein n=1 Tax=Arthrobacter sp. HMSC08H08 TaxID=1581143 RepID=UPI00159F6976|nr:Rieske (2Fe-2S) protein [Arthrobacter sp. HMSC08H08]
MENKTPVNNAAAAEVASPAEHDAAHQGCCASRRAVLGGAVMGAAALGLAACGPSGPAEIPEATGKPEAVMKVSDLAVGSQASAAAGQTKLVLFRPSEKEVLAFSAVCTHAGCEVTPGSENRFHCPCHESWFKAEDGTVISGPANAPLPRFACEIKGEDILVYI